MMRNWTELCSDVNWEDYHGMWARKAKDGTWFVLVWTNMWDAAGESEDLDQYECQVKSINLADMPEAEVASALRSAGLTMTPEGLVSDQGTLIDGTDGIHVELTTLECCIQYGLGAPLFTAQGSKRPLSVRASARRFAESCMRDSKLHSVRLEMPVNAIGSTAAEYGRGDIDSALMRGDSVAHRILRKMHGI